MSNGTAAREYLRALEQGETGEALRRFFTADFTQVEYPNALNPKGQHSDLANTLARSELGKKILRSQRYDITNVVESGDHVAIECDWSAVLAIPVAGLAAGAEMRAHFSVFLEFRGGRISRQRNYDCFEPLVTT